MSEEAEEILNMLITEKCDIPQCKIIKSDWFIPGAKPDDKTVIPLNYHSVTFLEYVGFSTDAAEQIYGLWKQEMKKLDGDDVTSYILLVEVMASVRRRLEQIPVCDSQKSWYDSIRHIGFTDRAIEIIAMDDDDEHPIFDLYPDVAEWLDHRMFRIHERLNKVNQQLLDRYMDTE